MPNGWCCTRMGQRRGRCRRPMRATRKGLEARREMVLGLPVLHGGMLDQLKLHPMLDVRKRYRLFTEKVGKTRSADTAQNRALYGRVLVRGKQKSPKKHKSPLTIDCYKSHDNGKLHPFDTQAKYTEQSATNVPLRSTGTQGAPCHKRQASGAVMNGRGS